MALPNSSIDKIKVYPDEYINNITVNRPNVRLLENDQYLYDLITSTPGLTDVYLIVDPPASSTSTGEIGQIASDSSYLYIYNGSNWGRVALDTSF